MRDMLVFGFSGIAIVALLTVFWGIFVYKKKSMRNKDWEWLHPIIATVVSVLFGFSLFFIQQGLSDLNKKAAIQKSVVEELKLIKERLESITEEQISCNPSASGSLMINPYLLPDTAIKAAAESFLFPANFTSSFMRLQNLIEDHNRWADFGFQILKDPTNPNAYELAKAQQMWQAIDEDLKVKATYSLECLTLGTSPSTGDKDCK